VPYAIIFPGQGAVAPAAGKAWRNHPAWTVVDEAEEALQRPVGRLLLDADSEELSGTGASQIAVLLASLVAWEALSPALEHHPIAFAGHSLGQITALIASGAVERHEGLRLAGERAEHSQRSADANPGRMAALVGGDLRAAQQACAGVDAWLANDNAPGQVVIAGTPRGVDEAAEQARGLGVRRVLPLDVGHAFHTPLLADVATGLRPLLDMLAFCEPTAPVVANADATAHTDPSVWPDQLERHLTQPVRWRESQYVLAELGAGTFVEVGPGRVLAGLARRTVPDVGVIGVATPDDVVACASRLRDDAPGTEAAARNVARRTNVATENVAAGAPTVPEAGR
jgi:[acyl-carrier-protein] S-malonyltransferase